MLRHDLGFIARSLGCRVWSFNALMAKFRMVSPSVVAIGCPHPPRNFDYSQLCPSGADRSISTCHRHKLADRGNFKISHSTVSALPLFAAPSAIFFRLYLFYLGCQGVNRGGVFTSAWIGGERALDKRRSSALFIKLRRFAIHRFITLNIIAFHRHDRLISFAMSGKRTKTHISYFYLHLIATGLINSLWKNVNYPS